MLFGWDVSLMVPYTSVYAGQVKDPINPSEWQELALERYTFHTYIPTLPKLWDNQFLKCTGIDPTPSVNYGLSQRTGFLHCING